MFSFLDMLLFRTPREKTGSVFTKDFSTTSCLEMSMESIQKEIFPGENFTISSKLDKINSSGVDVEYDFIRPANEVRYFPALPTGFKIDHDPIETYRKTWREQAQEVLCDRDSDYSRYRLDPFFDSIIVNFAELKGTHFAYMNHLKKLNSSRYIIETEQPKILVQCLTRFIKAFKKANDQLEEEIVAVNFLNIGKRLQTYLYRIAFHHERWCSQTMWYYKTYLQQVWVILSVDKYLVRCNFYMDISPFVVASVICVGVCALWTSELGQKFSRILPLPATVAFTALMCMGFTILINMTLLKLKLALTNHYINEGIQHLGNSLVRHAIEFWDTSTLGKIPMETAFMLDLAKQESLDKTSRL
ncbi:hypothetical protein PUMCH_003435 [Australozyma saopauloensis]|uniref:Uncharacterized protein n=1 Tax=Australozyma saopauloensis TaxID=291208 RepID=A0AAX4HCA3_9ASCO|nr:hypothetical protein PUMCH_003435 [[Candida] saopauloensis]